MGFFRHAGREEIMGESNGERGLIFDIFDHWLVSIDCTLKICETCVIFKDLHLHMEVSEVNGIPTNHPHPSHERPWFFVLKELW